MCKNKRAYEKFENYTDLEDFLKHCFNSEAILHYIADCMPREINRKLRDGDTPLHHVMRNGCKRNNKRYEMIESLLKRGASLIARSPNNVGMMMTPYESACYYFPDDKKLFELINKYAHTNSR